MSDYGEQTILTDSSLEYGIQHQENILQLFSTHNTQILFKNIKNFENEFYKFYLEFELFKMQKKIIQFESYKFISNKQKRKLIKEYCNSLLQIEECLIQLYHDDLNTVDGIAKEEIEKQVIIFSEKIIEVMNKHKNFKLDNDENSKERLQIQIKRFWSKIQEYEQMKIKKSITLIDYQNIITKITEDLNRDLSKLKEIEQNEIYRIIVNGTLQELQNIIIKKKLRSRDAPRALHIACEYAKYDIIEYLIMDLKYKQEKDFEGYFPIHYACFKDSEYLEVILELLVKNNAKIESIGIHHERPIHSASIHGNYNAVVWLLIQGAEVNCETFESNTPLHYAALRGSYYILKTLIDNGANALMRNIQNKTALMLAMEEENEYVVNYFWSKGFWLSKEDYELLLKTNLSDAQKKILTDFIKKTLSETEKK